VARAAARLLALALLAPTARAAGQELRVAQVEITGRATIDSLARLGFEVAGSREIRGRRFALVVVSDRTQLTLLRRGYAVTVPPDLLPLARAADSFRVYRSFDKPVTGIRATLAAWAGADSMFHLDSIGASIEGRPILAVKIGNAADAPGRPNVLFMATHHAREWVSTEVAMKLARWIADSLPRSLLAQRDIWVIPVQNPDGYQYTFTTERLWRKNRRLNADGSYGVDMNRNYPGFWGFDDLGSSGQPLTEIFRGTGPASEPETQAIVAFHAAHPPVVAVSYHTYSGLVLYPYGYHTGELAPDRTLFRALAGTDLEPAVPDRVPRSVLTYYHPGPGWNLYPTNGEYTDWAYRTHGTIAFTPELTSGCCTPDSNLYYDFRFPDDSALVEQVFRDNLPFAVNVIDNAADLPGAAGVSGLRPAAPRFESLWPESWLVLDAAAPQPLGLTLRTAAGLTVPRGLQTDSLRRGVIRSTWRTDVRTDTVRALLADGLGVQAELLTLAGAEQGEAGWTGWTPSTDAAAGTYAWFTGVSDTLVSPLVDLRGRTRVWLQFWTKHSGTTFAPEQRGLVQFSRDSGATWSDAHVIVGDGSQWYPVRVDLPQAAGARGARVRFVSRSFNWSVDAVGFASDSSLVFAPVTAVGTLEVSENPVRGTQVVFAWPASTGGGAAMVRVYTFLGQQLTAASVPAPNNEYVWDLTVRGRPVANGAYIVLVDVDGQRYRRRLFVAR
jgi:murein tripeptide amidase MpaA